MSSPAQVSNQLSSAKERPSLELLTFPDLVDMATQLHQRVLAAGVRVDVLLSLQRGGAVLARLLSDFMGDVPLFSFGMKSYHGLTSSGEIRLTQPLAADLEGKSVLLVDDISDSGLTFGEAKKYVQNYYPTAVLTASFVMKPHTTCVPDFVARTTTAWAVFPYEPVESMTSLAAFWRKDPHMRDTLIEYFVRVGYPHVWVKQQMQLLHETDERSAT